MSCQEPVILIAVLFLVPLIRRLAGRGDAHHPGTVHHRIEYVVASHDGAVVRFRRARAQRDRL